MAPIFVQNHANARFYLDISPKNGCHKPSWQGFRPPPPKRVMPKWTAIFLRWGFPYIVLVIFSFLSSGPGNIFYTQWLASSSKPPPIFFGLQGNNYHWNSCNQSLIETDDGLSRLKLAKNALNLTVFAQPRNLWAAAQESQESTGSRGSFFIIALFGFFFYELDSIAVSVFVFLNQKQIQMTIWWWDELACLLEMSQMEGKIV